MGQVHKLRTRVSDAELLRTEFRVHDPESLPGLNRSVPDADAHPTIIGFYDETPVGGRKANPDVSFIRCCHCGKRRHWKGYVIRDDHDQLHIIGASRCGLEHYGARFGAEEKAFREDRLRRQALLRWQNMRRIVPGLVAEVETLITCDALRTIERKREEIRRASSKAFEQLRRHCGSGNSLMEVKEERDYAAEEERTRRYERALGAYMALSSGRRRELRDEGMRPELETVPLFVRSAEPLGPLTGAGFLTDRGDVRQALLSLRETLWAVQALEKRGTESATSTELSRLLREMTDRPKQLQDALHELKFVDLFFSRENLERIARWSNAASTFTLGHEEGRLIVQDSKRGRTVIEPLGKPLLPETPEISYFHYLTDEFLPLTVEAA